MKSINIALSIISLLVLTVAQDAFAKELIGNGYSCSNGAIVKGKNDKVVKLSIAKKAINNKISALGSSKKDKAKKSQLKGVKAGLTQCIQNGVFVAPTPTPSSDLEGPSKPDKGGKGEDPRCAKFPGSRFCN